MSSQYSTGRKRPRGPTPCSSMSRTSPGRSWRAAASIAAATLWPPIEAVNTRSTSGAIPTTPLPLSRPTTSPSTAVPCASQPRSRHRSARHVGDPVAGQILVLGVPAALDVGEPHAGARGRRAGPGGGRVDAVRRRAEGSPGRTRTTAWRSGNSRRPAARGVRVKTPLRWQRDRRLDEGLLDGRIGGEREGQAGCGGGPVGADAEPARAIVGGAGRQRREHRLDPAG